MLDILCTGDLVLDEPDPDHWLGGIANALRAAAFSIGHLEVPHTRHQVASGHDVPAPGAPPEHLAALGRAGIDALTLAGNHIADCGAIGIADTVAELDALQIAHTGAGANLSLARAPAWLTHERVRIALLSYNCVGPEEAWATESRAGCAYIRVNTADGSPIAPAAPLHIPDDASLTQFAADIARTRAQGAGLCLVALHKGIVHTPARLAPYERAIAHAAIEAGADAVVSHHAHIVRGIEFHRGRPIFHGLGNGCVVTRALSPDQSHPKRAQWARRRRELFGFDPDPAYHLAPFHPEAVHGMMARFEILGSRIEQVGYVPLWFEAPGRPVRAEGARADAVCRYIARITRDAGLTELSWERGPDMIRVAPRS